MSVYSNLRSMQLCSLFGVKGIVGFFLGNSFISVEVLLKIIKDIIRLRLNDRCYMIQIMSIINYVYKGI